MNLSANWQNELAVARALTWRYVVALLLVASLSTAAWLSLHWVITAQKSTAAIVNISGRQRMLSQRTALLSNLLLSAPPAERAMLRGKLQEAIRLMSASHHDLLNGAAEKNLPASMSDTVRELYFAEPNGLNQQVESYILSVQRWLTLDESALHADDPTLRFITQTASTTLVVALDDMVRQYQQEGEAAIARLQKAETTFWGLTLLLLFLEALLIFRPFAQHVRTILGKLQRTSKALQTHHDQLEQVVQQRTAELESKTTSLMESEEKFRLISTSAQDAILISDAEGQISYWNPAAEIIFGYSAAEALGKPLHRMLATPQHQAAAHVGFEHFKHSGEGDFIGKLFEINALRKGGKEFPIEIAISGVNMRNRWHAVGVIRDITERKKSEAILAEKTQALLRSNADLERFAYSVSHDMRQPLRAVAGHLQLLEMGLKDQLNEDNRENLKFVLQGARRMDSMIVSLLEYSRIGRKTEVKNWVDSRAVLDEAMGFLQPAIQQAQANVSIAGEWPSVFVSRDELLRLLQNLIGNALHYHEPSKTPQVEIESVIAATVWRVSVLDHGIGIDPKQIDRLFQFFSRLQLRERFDGTGMGLALCRRIVEHHQGRIWVESAGEGHGSTFIFELALDSVSQAAAHEH